jgi:hypothetical protein
VADEAGKDVLITPEMIEAGVSAALSVEDETLGHLSRFSLEQLVVAVWAAISRVAPQR